MAGQTVAQPIASVQSLVPTWCVIDV